MPESNYLRLAKVSIKYDDNYKRRARFVKTHEHKEGWQNLDYWKMLMTQEKSLVKRGEKIRTVLEIKQIPGTDALVDKHTESTSDEQTFWARIKEYQKVKAKILQKREIRAILIDEGEDYGGWFHCCMCDKKINFHDLFIGYDHGLICAKCKDDIDQAEVQRKQFLSDLS